MYDGSILHICHFFCTAKNLRSIFFHENEQFVHNFFYNLWQLQSMASILWIMGDGWWEWHTQHFLLRLEMDTPNEWYHDENDEEEINNNINAAFGIWEWFQCEGNLTWWPGGKNHALLKLRLWTVLGSSQAALSSLKTNEELQRILPLFRFPFLQAAAHHNALTFLCFPTLSWIILQYHFLTSRWIILQGNQIPLLPMLLEP